MIVNSGKLSRTNLIAVTMAMDSFNMKGSSIEYRKLAVAKILLAFLLTVGLSVGKRTGYSRATVIRP